MYSERISYFSNAYNNSNLKNDHDFIDKSVVPCSKNPKVIANNDASWFY